MREVTRRWSALEAAGPREGPVREAIGALEPVFFAQLILAADSWLEPYAGAVQDGGATAEIRALARAITEHGGAEHADRLNLIGFVHLWPEAIHELRGELFAAAPDSADAGSAAAEPDADRH